MNKRLRKPTESPTILVVEADPELRRYLRRCLASLPSPIPRILEAEDLEQAILLVQDGGIDLVVGVLNGPGSGGSALCSALGVGDRGQVPVVLLATGVSSVGEVRDVRSLASTTLLPGTPSASRLCRTVSGILAEQIKEPSRARPVKPTVARRPSMRREEE